MCHISRGSTSITAAIIAAVAAVALAGPASAVDSDRAAVARADAAAVLTNAAESRDALAQSGDGATSSDGTSVSKDGNVSLAGSRILAIPGATKVRVVEGAATVSGNGQQYVVRTIDKGVRITSVLYSGDRSTYQLDIPAGAHAEVKSDGSVDIVSYPPGPTTTGVTAVALYATLKTPWAVDASGKKLATRYEVSGNVLTQVVATDRDTAYPISADPQYSILRVCGSRFCPAYGARLDWNKNETSIIADSGNAAYIVGACTAVGLASYGVVGVACGAYFGYFQIVAQYARNNGTCLQTYFYISTAVPYARSYSGGNCR